MSKISFNKPPLSVEEKIELLKKRNLIITNESFAKHKLYIVSFFEKKEIFYNV